MSENIHFVHRVVDVWNSLDENVIELDLFLPGIALLSSLSTCFNPE